MKKKPCELLDTYPDFQDYWAKTQSKDLNTQIRLWQRSYMKKYPELLAKQLQSYKELSVDWKDIARKIFPLIPNRLRFMQRARDNILDVYGPLWTKAKERLKLDLDVLFVIYVGIGCGAGWATSYDKQPAVLLGLENIVEEKWHTESKLRAMISHELGHLAHMNLRREWKKFEKAEENPVFLLYSEGFAQRCEHMILGRETWSMAPDGEWISWCNRMKGC